MFSRLVVILLAVRLGSSSIPRVAGRIRTTLQQRSQVSARFLPELELRMSAKTLLRSSWCAFSLWLANAFSAKTILGIATPTAPQ